MAFRLKKTDAYTKQILTDRGAPSSVIDHVFEDSQSSNFYEWLVWLVVLLCGGGIYIGVIFMWPLLVNASKSAALASARASDAIMFDYSFGPALLLGLLAWTFICLAIPGFILQVIPDRKKSVFKGFVSDPFNKSVSKHFLKKTIKNNSTDLVSPEKFISLFFDKLTGFIEWQAIMLSLLAGSFIYLELQAHTLISTTSVIQESILPFKKAEQQRLSDVRFVELGCNYIDESMSHLNYTLHFNKGPSVDLGSSIAVSGTWIDQVEQIDVILTAQQTEYRRWVWPGRSSMHPKCIERYAAEFGSDGFARVNALLRSDKF